ncbi:MAG: phenylalanine--tRNA ligase subunit alpha [Prevotella sp.]|nr:phenylalanine--tRNA ligase subunit alpha [Prevotella sp.]
MDDMEKELEQIQTEAELAVFHKNYLSKTGKLTQMLAGLKDLLAEQRAEAGKRLNALKRAIETQFFQKQAALRAKAVNEKLKHDPLIDITIPAINQPQGSLHPITYLTRRVSDICRSMGFLVVDGNEVVNEFENFDAVNIPSDHPARDMQDTFWLTNGKLLKTQTSAMQHEILKKYGPVVSAIFPGRCYRNEATDASHEFAFFQCEGVMVGRDISIANLIYVMKTILSEIYEKEIQVRLRPGYFPFVEPGFELDASCPFCGGKGCSVCKHSGWIEFCGCGMIHANVLQMAGVDPNQYQGFAFGFGLTRMAMMQYAINDIRLLNSGNLEFLRGIKR